MKDFVPIIFFLQSIDNFLAMSFESDKISNDLKRVEAAIDGKLNIILIVIAILVAFASLAGVYSVGVALRWYPHLKKVLGENQTLKKLRNRFNRKNQSVIQVGSYKELQNKAETGSLNEIESNVSHLTFYFF